jgi:hypothetical protein
MRRSKVQLQHREDEVLKLLRSNFTNVNFKPLKYLRTIQTLEQKSHELKHNNELHILFDREL